MNRPASRILRAAVAMVLVMASSHALRAADVATVSSNPPPQNAPTPGTSGTGSSSPTNEPPTDAKPATEPQTSARPASRSERDGSRPSRSERRRDRNERESSSNAPVASPAAGSGTDFPSFQVIPERNIFNINRSSRTARASQETEAKPAKIDTLALVGSMSYPKGDFAFFDGSSSDYRRVLKAGDSVAGFQIRSIGRTSVQLESAGKTLELAIGSHLRREEEGEWRLVAESAPPSSSSSSSSGRRFRPDGEGSSPPSSNSTAQSSEPGGGSADDILQRLMKKRETELK